MRAADVAAMIGAGRFDLTAEKACQADMEAYLAAVLPLGCLLQREHRLGPYDIPDFLIGGHVLVEVKLKGAQPRAVLRQLERYAVYREVREIVLASNRAMHVPPLIAGKPALFVSLGRAWL